LSSFEDQPERGWFVGSSEEVFQRIQSCPNGLESSEADRRLLKFGSNQLPEPRETTLLTVVVRQFLSPLIYLLVVAAGISLLIGDWKDALFIVGVLLINTAVGTYQEWKAEQSSRALRHYLASKASVVRDGYLQEVDSKDLVPGDVVQIESGLRLPADVRFFSVQQLQIDESLLTGESESVVKNSDWQTSGKPGLGDQLNMGFAGSVVVKGRGRGVVVSTGERSEIGRLAVSVGMGPGGTPPLVGRMERFTRVVALGTLLISTFIGLLGWGLGHMLWDEVFLFVIALAVAAIPEGLPVAMTVALAVAASKMSKRKLVVRRLAAVEGLGSCTLIATDKTGTLTCNEMTVRKIILANGDKFDVSGQGFDGNGEIVASDANNSPDSSASLMERLVIAGQLCNEAELTHLDDVWSHQGDPVDVAMLALASKARRTYGFKEPQHISKLEVPFESETQFAAGVVADHDIERFYLKGAPERILQMCELNHDVDSVWKRRIDDLASSGFRVLALADGQGKSRSRSQKPCFKGLTLLGVVGMLDPLRDGVRSSVQSCHEAGVQIAMVTGDHPATALSIGKELGLATDSTQVLTGPELEGLAKQEWGQAMQRVRIFARVSPEQKLGLVQAAQEMGHFVAVTGDGVNDAPALKQANIGVAMGKSGTDVAREAADLVIADDHFATIVAGIEEGRIAYDNIRKVVYLLMSGGAAELALVLFTLAYGLPLPLLPIQLLWLNLVTNGIQGVAMAFEPGEQGILKRRPRKPAEPIFNRLMIERMVVGTLIMGGVSFLTFQSSISSGASIESARNIVLALMVLFENFHVGNCRSETQSLFRRSPWSSPVLLAGAIAALTVHLSAMHLPGISDLLGLKPLSLSSWIYVLLLGFTVVVGMELHKWTWRRRYPQVSP
jgi:Ca2+-transporting ATPase